ncbi:MAG TPA: acyl-CoA dehydratase activase [Myxococcota bacterium]|nr:acyl-CoA dehydratase activase [Myxococcota bacterium]HRY92277.1 acyl-CoA dehydratase activase [Myxococcota bacterium]HSA22889.1 acyl-CoA dehydratase activase [Myxococcota bacterium]
MITLGVDIGSLTGKALVLEDDTIRAWELIPTGPDSVETGTEVTRRALAKAHLRLEDMEFIVSTGYGRIVIPFAHKNVSEISCHAKGAHWFFPQARTILDMGGQDCKAIRCDEHGKVSDFVMNDKCAAGAGRSMGIVSGFVDVPLEEIGALSLQAAQAVPISSTCVVFARSEILAHLRRGVPKSEILAGACEALVSRVKGLLKRVGTAPEFVISGGIAKNVGVVKRLESQLELEAHIAFEPQIVGALGAALFGREILTKRAGQAAARP